MGEITVSVVGSKNPNWFDTHQIPKNAAYAIPDEAATRLMTASLDVTDPTAATRVVSDAVDHFGRIDVLVNNAGYGLITAFEEMSPEQIHQQFATNVYGVMNVTRAVLPVMRRQRSGHLFTIASMGGYLGGSRGTAYAASKFAVAGFTESLALELEEFGITATIVGPGYFRTDFLDKSSAILEPATRIEDYRASNAAEIPTFTESHRGAFREAKSLLSLRQEVFQYRLPRVTTIVFQACSFGTVRLARGILSFPIQMVARWTR